MNSNNIIEKIKKKIDKKIILRVAALIYIIIITMPITKYSSKILLPDLFPNERETVDWLMYFAMIFVGLVLYFKEKNIIKMLIIYSIVLIFTAFSVMTTYDRRMIILIPMILSFIYDSGVGLAGALGICAYNVFTLADRPDFIVNGPEFMLVIVMLLVSGFASIVIKKEGKIYIDIIGLGFIYILSLLLHSIFGKYCVEYPGCEIYAEEGFKYTASKGVLFSILIFLVIRILYELFAVKKLETRKLKVLSSENYFLVREMKKNSISLYYHAIEVAEMSFAAAKAIGADEELAYTGGLMHDIGKMAGTNYIQEGVKIANRYKFPGKVKNIIIEHNVKSRLPKSKEAAIVMLADTAISAVEYLKTNNKADIDEKTVFENSLLTRLKTETLKDSGLTINEFYKIKDSFINYKELQQ